MQCFADFNAILNTLTASIRCISVFEPIEAGRAYYAGYLERSAVRNQATEMRRRVLLLSASCTVQILGGYYTQAKIIPTVRRCILALHP